MKENNRWQFCRWLITHLNGNLSSKSLPGFRCLAIEEDVTAWLNAKLEDIEGLEPIWRKRSKNF